MLTDHLSNFRRGDVHRFCFERYGRNTFFGFGETRAREDDEGGKLCEAREVFPIFDVVPLIRTDDPEKFRARIFFVKIFGGDIGVGFFLSASEFDGGDFEFFFGSVLQQKFEHFESMMFGRGCESFFEGGIVARDKNDEIQFAFFKRNFCDMDVRPMRRIECSAKKPDAFSFFHPQICIPSPYAMPFGASRKVLCLLREVRSQISQIIF